VIATESESWQPKRKALFNMSRNGIQFLKFCLVGGVNTGIDFALFALLTLAGLPYLAAQVISYSCGVLNSYFINGKWTFHSQTDLSAQKQSNL
jgi:putative flippase GtrA